MSRIRSAARVAAGAACLCGPAPAQWLEPGCETLLEVAGTTTGDVFGWDAGALGDVDGDGVGDFVTAAPLSDAGFDAGGFVRAFSGADGSTLWTRSGPEQSAVLGYALEVADWNGDGVLDVFASAPFAGAQGGVVYVYSGDSGAVLHTFGSGGAAGDTFGASVVLGFDLDADGVGDVAIGATGYDVPGVTGVGRVYVFSGAGGALLTTVEAPPGTAADAAFGTGLAVVGDVSSPPDGRDELAVGARNPDFLTGRAFVYSYDGAGVQQLYGVTGVGMGFGLFGNRMGGGADVSGDGVPDFLVGDHPAANVKVFSGSDGALLHTLSGDGYGSGRVIADVTGDGVADLLLGARGDDTGGLDAGRVLIHSGVTGGVVQTMTWTHAQHRLGVTARAIPDQDGDGRMDYLVTGTGGGTSGPPAGRFVVVKSGPAFANTCSSTPNSSGAAAWIGASGSASVAANELVLLASPVPAGQPGLFFYGAAQASVPFGNGLRCVGGGQLFRLPVEAASGNELSHALDLTHPPATAGQITAGSTWYFQAWFRDPLAGGAAFDLSNGLEASFLP